MDGWIGGSSQQALVMCNSFSGCLGPLKRSDPILKMTPTGNLNYTHVKPRLLLFALMFPSEPYPHLIISRRLITLESANTNRIYFLYFWEWDI